MKVLQYFKHLLTGKNTEKGKGCPACEIPNVICTNYDSFTNDYSGPFSELKSLKFGRLVKCNNCKTIWFVGNPNHYVDTVSIERLKIVEDWNKKHLSLSPEQVDVLTDIGSTLPDSYGNQKEFISVPCKCTLKSGEVIDNALISIQQKPPVGLMYDNKNTFYFIDQISSIEQSDIALPLKVRLETANSGEIRMGYAPTILLAPNNKLYITNGTTNFFYEDDIKGEGIKIPTDEQINYGKAIDTKNDIKEIRIVVDWSPDLESKFKLKKSCV